MSKARIWVINGPNLNFLQFREPGPYPAKSLSDIEDLTHKGAPGVDQEWKQSSSEGELIEWVHEARESGVQALVINPGGFSHTSVALHDALLSFPRTKVEVHLSHVYRRENFRHHMLTGRACDSIMTGLGEFAYLMAIRYIVLKDNLNVSNN